MNQKRGQITVFIILGLIVLLTIALLIYFQGEQITTKFDPAVKKQFAIEHDTKPLQEYIGSCLKQVSIPIIKDLAGHGGTLNPLLFRYHEQEKINYLCLDRNTHCESTFLTREEIEKELAEEINKKLGSCIDLQLFKNQGFFVNTSEKELRVDIADQETAITLFYPITLTKQDTELYVNTFSEKVDLPLGRLFSAANHIVNTEVTEGRFSLAYMTDHADIVIEKLKPYPDIVYKLESKGLTFVFAMQGRDTVSEVGFAYFGSNEEKGCCINVKDNLCYKNTNEELCIAKGGMYDSNPSCVCNEPNIPEIPSAGKECGITYDVIQKNMKGSPRKHLEAWCSFESVTDFGMDVVGSRHYLHYCINGKEYVEPCRDYREEYCGVDDEQAGCTANRWQDCITCIDESCCLDKNYRDCRWNNYETENKCTPMVAPGFKFWGGNALAMCMRANEKKDCEGFTCPQKWIDDTAALCLQQGDCGNWKNTEEKTTKLGFFNSDFLKKVSKEVYEQDTKPVKNQVLYSTFQTERASLDPYTYGEAINVQAELLSSAMSYVDEIGTISFSDFLNPFTGKPLVNVLDVSLCGVWQAPFGNEDCNKCNSGFYPCTEYKCKSLGQLCEFDNNKGSPVCFVKTSNDIAPPTITFSADSLGEGYTAAEQKISVEGEMLRGYELSPALKTNELVTFNILTNEAAKCSIKFVPAPAFNDVPAFNFGTNEFSTMHNVTFRVPERIIIPQKVLDVLNMSTVNELAKLILQPKDMLEHYKQKYKTALFLYKTFSGDDLTKKIDPLADNALEKIKLIQNKLPFVKAVIQRSLKKFEQNTYVLYLKCVDKSGNENMENIFLEFSIDPDAEDNIPPKILRTMPENNSKIAEIKEEQEVKIYLNEYSECRYDDEDKIFSEMKNKFVCGRSKYDISPVESGSYECKTKIAFEGKDNLEHNRKKIYIKCADNPIKTEQYELKIKKGSTARVLGIQQSNYLNVTSPNTILFSLPMLRNHGTFVVEKEKVDVELFKEKNNVCLIEADPENKTISNCMLSDKLYLGVYECNEKISLDNGKKYDNASFVFRFNNDFNEENAEIPPWMAIDKNNVHINRTISAMEEFTVHGNFSQAVMYFYFKEPYACKINNTESTMTSLFCSSSDDLNGATICKQPLLTNNDYNVECSVPDDNSVKTFSIVCKDAEVKKQNVNQQSVEYVLNKAKGLEIVYHTPQEELKLHETEITVTTTENEEVSCSYKEKFGFSYVNMNKVENNLFSAHLKKLKDNSNMFVIRCKDKYNNEAKKEIDVFVSSIT